MGQFDKLPWKLAELAHELEELISSCPHGHPFLRPELLGPEETQVSEGLVTALTFVLLVGPQRYRTPLRLSLTEPSSRLNRWFNELTQSTAGMRQQSLADAHRRMTLALWSGVPPPMLRWWAIRTTLEDGSIEEKSLASVLCGPLLTMDVLGQRLDALSSLVTLLNQGLDSSENLPSSRLIRLRVVQWAHYVEHELGDVPTKSEMQAFLLGLYPDLTDHPTTWADAWRRLKIGRNEERRRRGNIEGAIKLAYRASRRALQDQPELPDSQ